MAGLQAINSKLLSPTDEEKFASVKFYVAVPTEAGINAVQTLIGKASILHHTNNVEGNRPRKQRKR